MYGILTLQLLVTFGITAVFFFNSSVRDYIQRDPILLYVSMVMTIVLIIVLACCPMVRRKSPQNFIFLGLFTVFEGILVGAVCAYYDSAAVIKAVVATIIIVVALTLFAFQVS